MEEKEPYASQEEFNRRVVHYPSVPSIQLGPGASAHLVSGERVMVSFVTLPPNTRAATHRHEHEQVTIVVDGGADFVFDGKLYPVKKDDVIIVPSNTEHGAYASDRGCRVIDVFSPPREDFVEKLKKALSS